MSLPDENRLVDALRRGRLTPAEQADMEAYLACHPERRPDWDDELNLNYLLGQTPDAPVSSNFTARVMDACRQADQEVSDVTRRRQSLFSDWFPKLATALAAVCLAAFSYHQHQLAQRRELAQSIAEISRMASGTPIELLQNFDAIQRLNVVPVDVDRELIAALQ